VPIFLFNQLIVQPAKDIYAVNDELNQPASRQSYNLRAACCSLPNGAVATLAKLSDNAKRGARLG